MINRLAIVFGAALLIGGCAKDESASKPASQPQAASETAGAEPVVHEFKIGELTAFALRDGKLQFPNDNQVFGVGHSPEEVAELLRAANAPTDTLTLGLQPLLVRTSDRVLLFDTGAGGNMGDGSGKLLDSMREANIDPASVTDIFISHAHGDHIGGLTDGVGAAAFPNATVHVSAADWDFLGGLSAEQAPNYGIANHTAVLAHVSQKIKTFAPGEEPIPGLVTAVDIKGHTPGHSGYRISSGGESILYIGDSAHHYIVSVQRPTWTISFDGDPPTAEASRAELIERAAESGERIYAVHFPFPGVGRFTRSGDEIVWTPE